MEGQYSGSVKIATIAIPGAIIIDNDGHGDDGLCRFAPTHFGRYFNAAIMDIAHKLQNLNCTITVYDQIGTLNETTGNYSQLTGAVQSGEMDVSVIPIYYPLIDQHNVIEYSKPVFEDTMTIVSMYKMTRATNVTQDVLFMFAGIPQSITIGLAISFFIFVTLLFTSYKLLKPRNRINSIWTVFRSFLEEDHFNEDTDFNMTFATIVTASVFLVMTMLKNSVSTDLVTIDKAITVHCYKDILDRNIATGFSIQIPEYEKFKNAPIGSEPRRVFDQTGYMYELNIDKSRSLIERVVNQQSVMVGRGILVDAIGLFALSSVAQIPELDDSRVLKATDPDAARYTNSFIWNRNAPQGAKTSLEIVSVRLFESGLIKNGIEVAPITIISSLTPITSSILRKMSFHVEEVQPDYAPVNLSNIYYVLISLVLEILIALVVLLLEVFCNCVKQCYNKYQKRNAGVWRRQVREIRGRNLVPRRVRCKDSTTGYRIVYVLR